MRGRLAWYIFGEVGEGDGRKPRTVCLGPFSNQNEAQTAANKITDWSTGQPPEPVRYFSCDMQKVKMMHKAKMAQASGQLGVSLRPIYSANNKKTSRFEQIKESRGIE